MNHFSNCSAAYPEKIESEGPRALQEIDTADGLAVLVCVDCGALETKPTCGPLFAEALRFFASSDVSPDRTHLFFAGHMTGQAEKIYLGACAAAMFRPSPEHRAFELLALAKLSAIYGLEVSVFERPEIADEIWLHHPSARGEVERLSQPRLVVNSPEWHEVRGVLCGVPANDIDHRFHERRGYREPCDR